MVCTQAVEEDGPRQDFAGQGNRPTGGIAPRPLGCSTWTTLASSHPEKASAST